MAMTEGQIEYELRHWRNTSREENDKRQEWILKQWGFSGHPRSAVLEIGPGPFGGCLPFIMGGLKIGLDPLWPRYQEIGLRAPAGIMAVAGYVEDPGCRKAIGNEFDAVICFNVLEHGTSDFNSIDHIVPLLAKGGRFYFQQSFRGAHQLNEGHDHVMRREDFAAAIARNNLKTLMERMLDADPAGGFDYPQVVGVYERQ